MIDLRDADPIIGSSCQPFRFGGMEYFSRGLPSRCCLFIAGVA
jgi:hypothetical protein